jgi:uncharacterized membrane protein YfcA
VSSQSAAILAAGFAAGMVNTIVGSGSLLTFPVLIGFGYPPLVANVSNTIGLVPGSAVGAVGYRRELRGRGRVALELAAASVLGAVTGAVLLLTLPASAFKRIVPVFIALALVLVLLQPALARRLAARRPGHAHTRAPLLFGAIFVTAVYGGYFGAAQGVILLGILGTALRDSLQVVNAIKNVLAGTTNLVAGVVFAAAAVHVDWTVVLLLACGSAPGGWLGAHVGRRMPVPMLRAAIVAVGTFAIVKLVG